MPTTARRLSVSCVIASFATISWYWQATAYRCGTAWPTSRSAKRSLGKRPNGGHLGMSALCQKRTRRHFAASARNSSVSLPAAKECFRELLARRGVCLPALTTSMGGVPRTAALPVPLKQSGSNLRLGNQGNRNCAEGISPMPTQDREARMKLLVIAAALVISTSALAKNGGGGGGGGSGHSGPGMSMSHPVQV